MPDITSVSENVSLSPHVHFGSPLERQLEQKHFGSPSAGSSLFLDNDVLDNDISMDSETSEKMESVSCNENSLDPANDLPFKEIDKNNFLDIRRLMKRFLLLLRVRF